jgi:hypothetical protein
VCATNTKLVTGRYRPVPGTGTGARRSGSDPVDPVTRWDNLDNNTYYKASTSHNRMTQAGAVEGRGGGCATLPLAAGRWVRVGSVELSYPR